MTYSYLLAVLSVLLELLDGKPGGAEEDEAGFEQDGQVDRGQHGGDAGHHLKPKKYLK